MRHTSRTCQNNMCNIHWSVSEYNSNNAWYYNGNNGNVNNNNKNNSYSVRPLLELYRENDHMLMDYPIPYDYVLYCYYLCRRKKRRKPSQLIFEMYRCEGLIELCHQINLMCLKMKRSIAFIISQPKWREVLAADFRDRVAQTILVQKILPIFEAYESKDSYSCRVGKGGLRAAYRFKEYLRQVSENYTKDCYVFSFDFQGFFPSIDTAFWTPRVVDFIDKHYEEADWEVVEYLAETIYRHRPQSDCVKKSPEWMWKHIEKSKSLVGSTSPVGLAIGNVTSQTLANFITTEFLKLLEELGIRFVCYTDDIKGVVVHKREFLSLMPFFREFCWQRMRLRLHPKKFDIQHYSKGIRVGAFKVRFDRILPNDRIAHNWLYKMHRFADLVSRSPEMVWQFKDKVVSVCNSYLGLLKWCNSYRLRTQGVDMLKNSEWSKYIEFDKDNFVAHTFKKYTENAVVMRQTRERKREFELQMAMAA